MQHLLHANLNYIQGIRHGKCYFTLIQRKRSKTWSKVKSFMPRDTQLKTFIFSSMILCNSMSRLSLQIVIELRKSFVFSRLLCNKFFRCVIAIIKLAFPKKKVTSFAVEKRRQFSYCMLFLNHKNKQIIKSLKIYV